MELYSPKMKEYLALVEKYLDEYLPDEDTLSEKTAIAMKYACKSGGKRIRPVLLLTWAANCGGNVKEALPFACALEMLHCYSLIHDDMPCMDNSPLRHGKPSVHRFFGENIALLAGDGLLTRAFEVMLNPENSKIPVEKKLEASFILADAAGINGMVGGQNLDLVTSGKQLDLDTILLLHSGKTAALIKAACLMGAHLAGADKDTIRAAATFGENIGISFQIIDDILDVTASTEELGKPSHIDEENEKNTIVSLLGVEEAKKLAIQYTDQAIAAMEDVSFDAEELCAFAKSLITRIH